MRCLFCGPTKGLRSDEHVIPVWARDAFAIRGPLTVRMGVEPGEVGVTDIGEMRRLNIKLRGRVCERCNNEFLSQLENVVAPILKPMMLTHAKTVLDPVQQAALATWAVKTVWLYEMAVRQRWWLHKRLVEGYLASEVEMAWLWRERRPPPRARVWLGCWDCEQSTAVQYEPSGAPLPTDDDHPVEGHLTTFALGYVAFQVFTVDFIAADEHNADPWNGKFPSKFDDALFRIWPDPLRDIVWPGRTFGRADWPRLVTWGGCLRPNG